MDIALVRKVIMVLKCWTDLNDARDACAAVLCGGSSPPDNLVVGGVGVSSTSQNVPDAPRGLARLDAHGVPAKARRAGVVPVPLGVRGGVRR